MAYGLLGHYTDSPLPAPLPLRSTGLNQEAIFYLPVIVSNDRNEYLTTCQSSQPSAVRVLECDKVHGREWQVARGCACSVGPGCSGGKATHSVF